jgi:hypothetical protein
MPLLRQLVLLAVIVAAAFGLVHGIAPRFTPHRASEAPAATARVFVFGSLQRPGDAATFRPWRAWSPVVAGAGSQARVFWVLAPETAPRPALASPAAILTAQSRGDVVVLDAGRAVPTSSARNHGLRCEGGSSAVC